MTRDTLIIIGVTAACTAVVGALGAVLVGRARRLSLVLALVAAALVPFVAVVLSIWVNVGAMFISPHDAGVARLVLALSALPAVGIALLLGRTLVADVRALGERARAIVLDSYEDPGTGAPVTAEMASLLSQLTDTREELSASRERERALEASRRKIVAFLSHDLRAPLAGVRATVEGLQDGVLTDTGAAYDGVRAAVDRMSRLIDDLADLSQVQGAPAPRTTEPVDLTELVEASVTHVEPAAATQGVRLEVDLPGPVEVVGVPDELARVLDNLLSNAVRSSGAGGSVRVSGGRAGRDVTIAVADTCGGIPEGELDRVFEEGWQGSPHATRGSEGLGLAIVERIVVEHGGRVSVAPTQTGCRFEISLPALARDSAG